MGKETEEHRCLDHGNSVPLDFSMALTTFLIFFFEIYVNVSREEYLFKSDYLGSSCHGSLVKESD